MQGFIKSRTDFKTMPVLEVIDYAMVLASIYDDVSKFSVLGEVALNQGDFFFFNGQGWLIDSAEPSEGATIISASDLVNLFVRPIIYYGPVDSTEQFIAEEIVYNFVTSGDEVYDAPYISIEILTSTAFIPPEVESGLYSLKSYISLVRRLANIFVTFKIENNRLVVTIQSLPVVTRKIDFGDGEHMLTSENYSASSVSKITAVEVDEEDVITNIRDFYLMTDDTIVESPEPPTGERVSGDWTVITASAPNEEEEEPEDQTITKVVDEFLKNSYSHLIEFESTKTYGFYDRLYIRIRGRVFRSYISEVQKTYKSNRTLYKSGELRRTLVDKLKEMV